MTATIHIEKKSTSQEAILTPEALKFLTELHKNFNKKRLKLLKDRIEQQHLFLKGESPKAPREMYEVRKDPFWKVNPPPKDLEQRWVEITGPTDKKMVINALNSGADTFMADFEDANCPTWDNLIEGQNNLKEAVRKTLSFKNEEGKEYKLKEKIATLMVRPRGWHLPEKHIIIDGEQMSGSLFDFGLYFFHNAEELLKRGSGPYFYLPKMESYHEAELWNEVFKFSENYLKVPFKSIRATVLIETIPAAFHMEDILFALKDYILGLNAGRWDYIFSIIKKLHTHPFAVFPDRDKVTMTLPFMMAYAQILVMICHKRNAYAIGGMSAFVPSRKDPEVNKLAFAKVYEDKMREVGQGFDGTWVAHPDLVQIAREPFEKRIGKRKNQIDWPLPPVTIQGSDLLNFFSPSVIVTEKGVRSNINVTLRYLAGWFQGVGAQAIFNLMEDAATAEISRAQLWEWNHRQTPVQNKEGHISPKILDAYIKEEMAHIQNDAHFAYSKGLPEASKLLIRMVLEPHIPDFLTLPAYEYIK